MCSYLLSLNKAENEKCNISSNFNILLTVHLNIFILILTNLMH